jgi:dephospho-CoA kinase
MSNINIEQFKNIRDRSKILLLGVTGGIASGKTTVADMLKDLGAHTIDFDILARHVVEPGKQALKEIIAYFGDKVILNDGHLDRKKLGGIVFQDDEKRKRLESIIHPYIFEEFTRQVREIAKKDPHAIIQAVIPLLFEVRLQHLVHKILVVYIPKQRQIERLVARDGITKEEAADRLKAQLPISEKVIYGDFMINNDCPVEETKKQVEDLWQTLNIIQKEKRKE